MNRFLAKKWSPCLLLAIATFLVWGQTVTFKFVWDDDYFIQNLQSVRSLRNIPEMFYRLDAQATLPDKFEVFRPIRTAHYALLNFLGGKETPQPWIYHLANVLWHGATAMMLFASLTLLLARLCHNLPAATVRACSLWIALAFAIHPVVSEVVCWAKSLDDILATFFTLAAFRELLLPPENKSVRWRALLFFALAVYSKESAVPFAIIVLFIFQKIHRLPWKKSCLNTAAFLFVAGIYVIHRHLVIGRSSQTAPISGSYGQTLTDMLPVVPEYVRLLLGIPPFCIDYSFMRGGNPFWSPEVLIGLGLLLALLAAGFFAWRKPGFEAAGFGLLWTGLFLLPVSNLLPMMQYMAERFLYLPLIGWLIALGTMAMAIPRRNIIFMTGVMVIFLWAALAWKRSWIWHDAVTLFVTSSEEGHKTQRVEQNAVAAILDTPQIHKFFSYDRNSQTYLADKSPDNIVDNRVLGMLEQTYRLFPTNHDAVSYYGIALATTHQPEKAIPLLQSAVQLQPNNLDDWLNLIRAELDVGQTTLAGTTLDKISPRAITNTSVMQLRFRLEWQTGDYNAAYQTMSQLNKVAPDDNNAYWLFEVEKKLNGTNVPTTNIKN